MSKRIIHINTVNKVKIETINEMENSFLQIFIGVHLKCWRRRYRVMKSI